MLAAMLNKAKQFYDIDFSNVDVLREALATSESTITGIGKTGENRDLYTKESTFRAEAEAQNYTPTEIKDLKETLTEKGVKLVKDAKDITQEDMKSYIDGMGIKTGEQFIDSFSKLGFSRDELQSLYKDYGNLEGMKSEEGQTFSQMYSDYLKTQETANLEPDAKAANELETTNSLLSGILAAVGGISLESGKEELNKVRGGKGKDTEAQRFGQGLNASGNKFINEQEYTATKQRLETERANNQRIIDGLNARKSELSGSEKKNVESMIADYEKANNIIDYNLQQGEKKHQQLLDEKSAQEELNNSKEEEKSIDDSSSANDAVLQNAANLKKLSDAANDLNMNPVDFNKLFNLGTGEVSQTALDLGNIINTLKASGVEVEGLSAALQNLGPGGLEKLSDVDLGKLISSLELTQEQADAINALNPNLQVTATADTSEADAAVQEVEAETAQPKVLKVVAETVGNAKQAAQQAADQANKQGTATNNITLQSTIANPNEPKEKIDAAMPKDYQTTVNATITMNASVKTGGLGQQMQAAASSASKGIKVSAGTTSTVTAKTKGLGDVTTLNTAIKGLKGTTINVKANVTGLSQVNSLKSAISNLHDKTVKVTYKQSGHPSPSVGLNNYIPHQAPIHANSLATGTLGNKRKKNSKYKELYKKLLILKVV